MPFKEPIKLGDTMDTVRKITRLAQVIIDLRSEYERRPRQDILAQIKQRSAELNELAQQLDTEPPKAPIALPEAQ